MSTRWHEGKHRWKPAGILTPEIITLLEGMVSDRRAHQHPHQCWPREGGIGSVVWDIGDCPVSTYTSGLAERVCFR